MTLQLNAYLSDTATVYLADATTITSKATSIGFAILGAGIILALLVAFFSQSQRRWVVVVTIFIIGAVIAMIIGDPVTMLKAGGTWIKTNIWDPITS